MKITTFGTTPESVELIGPEHQWEPVAGSAGNERYCKTCEMTDRPVAQRAGQNAVKWQVVVPCIEPVPERVEYQALMLKLIEHGIEEKISYVPDMQGFWTVGFEVGNGEIYPELKAPSAEHGFARLLRWCRVRRYNLELYSDFGKKRRAMDRERPS